MARKYLEDSVHTGKSIKNSVVCGLITWDEESGGAVPRLIIDGEEVSWINFGKMLMTYEGFQFKLGIFDITEDVDV